MNERQHVGTPVAWCPRSRPGSAVAVGALVLVSFAAAAHHSINAAYDSARQEKIEGVVVEFQFVNPHPFLVVTVTPIGAEPEAWRLEMDNRFELRDIGMTSNTLRPGDRVVVTGSAGRTEPRTLYVRRLDRPADGFRYEQIGSQPRLGSARP